MSAIMNVDRWLAARRIWRWQNEIIVERLARDSLRRDRSTRGLWTEKKNPALQRGAAVGLMSNDRMILTHEKGNVNDDESELEEHFSGNTVPGA